MGHEIEHIFGTKIFSEKIKNILHKYTPSVNGVYGVGDFGKRVIPFVLISIAPIKIMCNYFTNFI